jgi:DNA-binding response OmpR family regulator
VREQALGTILCVDEHEANRHALTRVFRDAGFEAMGAATGAEALAAETPRPDLVLLVVTLPDLGALKVCRQIKALPATATVPVLCLFGGEATPAEKDLARAAGAEGCLTMPEDPQELVAQAQALLRPSPLQTPKSPGGGPHLPGIVSRSGLTKAEAERLLDWLEANGCRHREVAHEEGVGFVVRWRQALVGKSPRDR